MRAGQPFTTQVSKFCAPEVADRSIPTPSTDLYALGKSIIYLAGGDVEGGKLPSGTPEKIKSLISWMTMESTLQRPRDAYAVGDYL
jgi:hypothetical protein